MIRVCIFDLKKGSCRGIHHVLVGKDVQLGDGREPLDAPRPAYRVCHALSSVCDRLLKSTSSASNGRLYGATVPVAIRSVDVHHHCLDSASRAPYLLKVQCATYVG